MTTILVEMRSAFLYCENKIFGLNKQLIYDKIKITYTAKDDKYMEIEQIKMLLKHNWSIDVENVIWLPQSTASCLKIETKNKAYFMKIFQSSYHENRAVLEYDVCKTLCENGLPVANIIPTNSNQPYILFDKQIIQLQDFEVGLTPKLNSLSKTMLCEAAEYLGKIHFVLKEKDLPILFDNVWLNKFDEIAYNSFYLETLNIAEKSYIPDIQKNKIFDDLLFLIEFTKDMSSLSSYFDGITYTASHGDYLPSQLICNDQKIQKIIDFANAHNVPIVLELMRFYWMASIECKTPEFFEINTFMKYLNSYMKHYPLTKIELRSMPYIYLYYMGRNRFIYREYLRTGNSYFFQESSWRVDVIRYLYKNADCISAQLGGLIF